MSRKFSDFDKACKARGLEKVKTKSGHLWKGMIHGRYERIAVHQHAKGRDMPSGTFLTCIHQLGFSSEDEYNDFINNL